MYDYLIDQLVFRSVCVGCLEIAKRKKTTVVVVGCLFRSHIFYRSARNFFLNYFILVIKKSVDLSFHLDFFWGDLEIFFTGSLLVVAISQSEIGSLFCN